MLSRCAQGADEECIEAENSSEASDGEVWDRIEAGKEQDRTADNNEADLKAAHLPLSNRRASGQRRAAGR